MWYKKCKAYVLSFYNCSSTCVLDSILLFIADSIAQHHCLLSYSPATVLLLGDPCCSQGDLFVIPKYDIQFNSIQGQWASSLCISISFSQTVTYKCIFIHLCISMSMCSCVCMPCVCMHKDVLGKSFVSLSLSTFCCCFFETGGLSV